MFKKKSHFVAYQLLFCAGASRLITTIVQLTSTPEVIISFLAKFFSLSISDIQR